MKRKALLASMLIAGLSLFNGSGARADDASVDSGYEMVEVTIRMPDGRVLTRYERRYAARVELPEGGSRS